MAVYDGFFDAVANEETGKFDREYGSGDFTNYFAHIIGSGVCIHNNPGSYKAEFEDGTLYLRPGYLFIQGYWLANKPGPDEDPATYKGYAVALPTGQTGPLAIVAHLNLGKRMIELELIPLAESYPNSLVLALIDPAAGSVQDTRYDAGICGVIDTAGELSKKAAWALDYIDNEIEGRLSQVEADIAEQNDAIKALEAAVAEERKKLAAEQGRKYDGGMFTWPAPSYTRISDEYGNRMHPTLGIQKFHNGIDMAAPGGSAILAAYNGKVVAADYNGSMGNYIMIDHGDSLYTIYMHASALYVSKGAEVSKGDKIAAVGSTGRSTGNHLHFSVRLNGNYVNPRNYLGS